MIWIEPRSVILIEHQLDNVRSIVVNSTAQSVVEERAEDGPHIVFGDAAGLAVEVLIERQVSAASDIGGAIQAGGFGVLRFTAAPSNASAHQVTYVAEVLITAVKHALHGGGGPTQRIVCRAISSDGAAHPIVNTQAGSTT